MKAGVSCPDICFGFMHVCMPSCRCWPRDGAPFTEAEGAFMKAGVSYTVSIVEFMHMMDVMVDCVGRHRVGYLLSVPVAWGGGIRGINLLMTPWIRLERSWTTDLATSVVFAEKMLAYVACCRMMYRTSDVLEHGGWHLGSSRHPGRAAAHLSLVSPLEASVNSRNSGCYVVLQEGIAQRVRQGRRWDLRVARQSWAVLFVQGVPE